MKLFPSITISNRLSLTTGLFVAVWGLLVIVAWHMQDIALARLHGPWEPMPYDAALGLFLCGAGLVSASLGSWRIAFGCGLLVCVLAALALPEYLFHVDLSVAEILMPAPMQRVDEYSSHMTLNAAGALFLSGLMLVTIGNGLLQKAEGYAFANMLGLLVALFGLMSLFSYFSSMDMTFAWQQLISMAPPAALGFTLLGFSAAIFRWPEDAEDNVDVSRLQNMVIAYVAVGVLVTMLFSAAIGLLPLYELVRSSPAYEAAQSASAANRASTLTADEYLDVSLRRQMALTGIATLLLAYIGGFGVWRLLRPLTGRILMRADALEKMIQKATEELEASVKNLQRSNRQLDQFARVASHDLQSPLHGIAGFAQIIQDRYGSALGQEGQEFIGYITGGANQMQAQINGLLELSRLNSRAQPTLPVPTGEVVAQLLTYLQVDIEQAGAKVHYQDLPTVHGDRAQIALLFQNLIANAIKFRRTGITPEVTISAQREGAFWRFSMQDNGIGIDPVHREAIFEIFRRLHRQEEYPGTGIGLALCKEIVERHGGVISVESRQGEGCRFVFTLPAAPLMQPGSLAVDEGD
jgi:signal transduction histidine kinase